MSTPAVETWVARDRARRLARRVSDLLQDRRLAWRGAEAGLATVVDRGEELLAAAIDDAEESALAVVETRVRDRERPYMDLPLAVAAESAAGRLRLAREVERARRRRALPDDEARAAFAALAEAAVRRLNAFAAAYDEKRPAGPTRPVEVARILEAVESGAALRIRAKGGAATAGPASDSRPPPLPSDPDLIEDLLLAARDALPSAPGPWRTRRARGGGFLRLELGSDMAAAPRTEPPARLARAAEVLRFLHPVEIAWGAEGVSIRLADPSAVDLGAVVGAAGGDANRLPAEAERAVRLLLRAPPLPESGAIPGPRLVAIQALLKALDGEVARALLPRFGSAAARVAAASLPRETTRKAPPRRETLALLEAEFPALPVHRVGPLAEDAAKGRGPGRAPPASDVAVLLALTARGWSPAGRRGDRALDLGDWTEAEEADTVRDLAELGSIRRNLEAGLAVPPVEVTRLERAAVALLGRLARLP